MQTKISRDDALDFLAGYPALSRTERLVSYCHLTTGYTSPRIGEMLGVNAAAVRKTLQRARGKMRMQADQEAATDLVTEPPQWAYVNAHRLIGVMDVAGSIVDLGQGLPGRPLTEYDVAVVVQEGECRRRVLQGPLTDRKLELEKKVDVSAS